MAYLTAHKGFAWSQTPALPLHSISVSKWHMCDASSEIFKAMADPKLIGWGMSDSFGGRNNNIKQNQESKGWDYPRGETLWKEDEL